MTDYTALLAACCIHPDDDTPRLVLADWLDDHGEGERAAFVRRQCEPGYAPDWRCPDDPSVRTMTPEQRRHRVMLPGFRLVGWDGAAVCYSPTWPTVKRVDVVFQRGFPAELTTTADLWVAHGDALSWHPSEARPCPPTACPGVVVRLSTEPILYIVVGRRVQFGGDSIPVRVDHITERATLCEAALSARWPGVRAWHLPEPVRGVTEWRLNAPPGIPVDTAAVAAGLAPATFEITGFYDPEAP